jgi:hypothetical protein
LEAAAPLISPVNPLSFAREVLCPELKVGKPCKERGLQKLDMHDGHSQFVQSPLPICDLGAELIMIVFWTARQILIGIIAQGYCGSRQRVIDT